MQDRLEYVANTHNDFFVGHVGIRKLQEGMEAVAFVHDLPARLKFPIENCGRCIQSKDLHSKTQKYPF